MVLDEQQQVQKMLNDYFIDASDRNPQFSLRAFSARLGVSSSSLSEIMRGRRKVSGKMALQFAKALKIDPSDINKIESLFDRKQKMEALCKLSNPFREVILSESEFDLLADWRYFAIVALMRTSDFSSDVQWIANRLSLEEKEVHFVIEKLIELKIVHRNSNGKLTEDRCSFRTSDDYPDDLIRKRQVEGLNSAISSIQSRDTLQAGFYSTISAAPQKLEPARKMIEEFLKKLSIFLHQGEPSEILELQIQLFPRSKRGD